MMAGNASDQFDPSKMTNAELGAWFERTIHTADDYRIIQIYKEIERRRNSWLAQNVDRIGFAAVGGIVFGSGYNAIRFAAVRILGDSTFPEGQIDYYEWWTWGNYQLSHYVITPLTHLLPSNSIKLLAAGLGLWASGFLLWAVGLIRPVLTAAIASVALESMGFDAGTVAYTTFGVLVADWFCAAHEASARIPFIGKHVHHATARYVRPHRYWNPKGISRQLHRLRL